MSNGKYCDNCGHSKSAHYIGKIKNYCCCYVRAVPPSPNYWNPCPCPGYVYTEPPPKSKASLFIENVYNLFVSLRKQLGKYIMNFGKFIKG